MSAEATTAQRVRFFPSIVEECLDDADFLWTRWERFLDAPDLSVDKVYFWVEQRLHGALDGLRTGELTLLEGALASTSPGAVSAAAHVLATSQEHAAFELLSRAFTSFEDASLTAIRRGIEVADDSRLLARLGRVAAAGSTACRAAWLDAHTACGVNPGALLPSLLRAPEPEVRAAAFRACRYAPEIDAGELRHGLNAPERAVVAAAVETGLARNLPEAWQACLSLCGDPDPDGHTRSLLSLLAMSGNARAEQRLRAALDQDVLRRDAVFALGASGRVTAADSCIAALRDGPAGRAAADAFCTITGLVLADASLIASAETPEPPDFESDDLDADLRPHIYDALPEPDVAGVEAWWHAHRSEFHPEARYLRGKPLGLSELQTALREGPARWRHVHALELALRSSGAAHLSTRAFARTQRRQLIVLGKVSKQQLTQIQGWAPLH
jgi:uncharacterized protein (TIGR02270 family)